MPPKGRYIRLGGNWVQLGGGGIVVPPEDTQKPTPPTNLRLVGAATSTTASMTADPSTDNVGVVGYEVRKGSGAYVPISGPGLLHTDSSLSPQQAVQYTWRGYDAAGNRSDPSNVLSFTTPGGGGGGGGSVSTLMGVPDNGGAHGYTDWPAWRIYDFSQVNPVLTKGAQVIALTDSGTAIAGGATAANGLRSFLMSFYGKTGTPSKNANIQIHFANGNEVDRKSLSALAFANTYELMEAVIADFPMASLWIDGTALNLRNGVTENYLMAQASSGRRVYQMLDGYAGSYYSPGRNDYPAMTASSYTGNSVPSFIIDPYIAKAVQKGLTRMAIWEFGMPMLVDDPVGWPNEGNTVRNNTRRRDYVQSFINYWFGACLAAGLTPEVALYWDQQVGAGKGTPSNTNPDNRLVNDNTLITPNTATIWRNTATSYVP